MCILNKVLILFIFFLLIGNVSALSCHNMIEDTISDGVYDLKMFLADDKTDKMEYNKYHTCSDFSSELRKNASKKNIIIFGLLVSHNPYMQGMGHAVNFAIIDNDIIIIEPQDDNIYTLKEYYYYEGYQYLKFYTGIQNVPKRFRGYPTPDINMKKYNSLITKNCHQADLWAE